MKYIILLISFIVIIGSPSFGNEKIKIKYKDHNTIIFDVFYNENTKSITRNKKLGKKAIKHCKKFNKDPYSFFTSTRIYEKDGFWYYVKSKRDEDLTKWRSKPKITSRRYFCSNHPLTALSGRRYIHSYIHWKSLQFLLQD